MRRKLVFQTKTETADNMGGFTYTWADTVTLWCEIRPTSAREKEMYSQLEHRVTHRIFPRRYNSSITPEMRIKYGDRYLEIRSVMNKNERDRKMEILADEVKNA